LFRYIFSSYFSFFLFINKVIEVTTVGKGHIKHFSIGERDKIGEENLFQAILFQHLPSFILVRKPHNLS